MADAIELRPVRDASGCALELQVHEPDLVGKMATVRIERRAQVKKSSPVHKSEVLLQREIDLRFGIQRVPLGDALAGAFRYVGHELDLALVAHVTVDDG